MKACGNNKSKLINLPCLIFCSVLSGNGGKLLLLWTMFVSFDESAENQFAALVGTLFVVGFVKVVVGYPGL